MGLKDLFNRMKEKKFVQQEIEDQRRIMKNIEQREINPNEREVIEFREKARQEQIVQELKAWKKLEQDKNNKGTFLTKDYYFNDNSVMVVKNQFAQSNKVNHVLGIPNIFGGKKRR